jgi:hypothetical protein
MSQELTIIQPERSQGLIRQVADTEEIKRSMQEFQQLKAAILSDNDYQSYRQWVRNPNGGGGQYVEKRFTKKSGWKNLAMALGINVEPVGLPLKIDLGDGHYSVTREVKATAPNGRFAVDEGSCDTKEERFKKYQGKGDQRTFVGYEEPKFHDISSTAYTRAANRAISALVGGGEVSAEEVDGGVAIESGPPMLSDGYYNRLLSVAREIDSEAGRIIAELILPKVGRYFSQEDAIQLGKTLKQLATPATVEAEVIPARTQQAAQIFDAPEPEQTNMGAFVSGIGPNNALATVRQLEFLKKQAKERGIGDDELNAMCWDKYGYGTDSLTKSQATQWIDSWKTPV